MASPEPPSPTDLAPARVRRWLVLGGLALPFITLAIGWWLADKLADGKRSDDWWSTAGLPVHAALLGALVVAAWCCVPAFRRIEPADQVVLAGVLVTAYFIFLFGFDFHSFLGTGAPFP